MKNTRNTIAKTTIHGIINQSENALSQGDIQKQVGDLCNRVTIYRILDRLVEEGGIHKIVNIDGVIKYASCNQCDTHDHHHHDHTHHNHIHFSCVNCQSVTCLDNIEPNYKLPPNYLVQEANFMLSGLCPDCSSSIAKK